MEIKVTGHSYHLKNIKYHGVTKLDFYKDPVINGGALQLGTNCQEVIRALIDRVKFLNEQKPWDGNNQIVNHLRQALALFECRAILRKIERGDLVIESLPTALDGHIMLVKEPDDA